MKPSTRIKEILVDKYGGSVLELAFAVMDYLDEEDAREQASLKQLQKDLKPM